MILCKKKKNYKIFIQKITVSRNYFGMAVSIFACSTAQFKIGGNMNLYIVRTTMQNILILKFYNYSVYRRHNKKTEVIVSVFLQKLK